MRSDPDYALPDPGPEACALNLYCSYFGTYTYDPSGPSWTVRVEGGNIPSYLGTDQTRHFTIDGDRLTIVNEVPSRRHELARGTGAEKTRRLGERQCRNRDCCRLAALAFAAPLLAQATTADDVHRMECSGSASPNCAEARAAIRRTPMPPIPMKPRRAERMCQACSCGEALETRGDRPSAAPRSLRWSKTVGRPDSGRRRAVPDHLEQKPHAFPQRHDASNGPAS